jgi:cytochrome P450
MTDIEHFDLSISFGLLANAAPTSFWLVYYIYSNPKLLLEVRTSINSVIGFQEDGVRDAKPIVINIPEVAAKVPLLASFISEVLRVQSVNASARVVREDTILDGKYLLKRNSFIFIPSAELHSNHKAWGPSASCFDPYRFTAQKRQGDAKGNRIPVSAHRSWGGGVNLCPGRFFAMNELLSLLVVMVMKYDVSPVSGKWEEPETKVHVMASIMEPAKDVPVRIRCRTGINFEFVWQPETVAGQ